VQEKELLRAVHGVPPQRKTACQRHMQERTRVLPSSSIRSWLVNFGDGERTPWLISRQCGTAYADGTPVGTRRAWSAEESE
jgi:hypothetical protein